MRPDITIICTGYGSHPERKLGVFSYLGDRWKLRASAWSARREPHAHARQAKYRFTCECGRRYAHNAGRFTTHLDQVTRTPMRVLDLSRTPQEYPAPHRKDTP